MAITEIFSRLPTFAKPLLYNLQLKPCLANSRCEGRVTIDLEITQPTSYLKLHSAEIDIKSATLQLENGCMFTELPFLLEHKPMFVTFTLPNEVDAQKARLEIVFVARLTDKTMGFCRYSFTDASAAKKLLAFTQFESTYARKAFPCWDEPEYKAKFTVSLEVDEHMTALSNMPAVAELKLEATGKKIVNFSTTPNMSTFLLCFAVGEFEYIQTKSKSGIDIRVYTTLGKQYLGEFALEVAGKSIDWYTEWFAMESPLTKCDLLAVPSFAPGAMENWGLVIAREPILFMDSMKSSIQSKIDVSLAVSHEIAHFWFGNLVTMKWWDDLWLNEGFANWIMNEAVGSLYPTFKVHEHFLREETSKGLALDSFTSSHPISLTIDNPDKLEDVFDAVTCCKPSSLIQMLSTYLGASVFQKGLRDYVQKHKFANSTADDLWTAVSEASNQNVNEIMESWTKQAGYPLIFVEQKIVGTTRLLKLRQTRFSSNAARDQNQSLWKVPIQIITASNPNQPSYNFVMTEHEYQMKLTNIEPTEWIKLNAGTSGFYRMHYSKDMLDSLLQPFSAQQISVADRFGLVSDMFALIQSGHMLASEFLRLLKYCCEENEYTVWSAIDGQPTTLEMPSSGLHKLASLMEHHPDSAIKDLYNGYICACLAPATEFLDLASVSSPLKSLVFNQLAKSGHKLIIDMALQLFDHHAEEAILLASDLRAVVFGCVARQNDLKKMGSLMRIYTTCDSVDIQRECLQAIGQCSDKDLLASIYKYLVEEGHCKSQDIVHLFFGSQTSKTGQEFSWEYFKCNYRMLIKKFGCLNNSFKQVMKTCASSLFFSNAAQDVENFCKSNFDRNQLMDLESTINEITDSLWVNQKLVNTHFHDIAQFLSREAS